MKRTLLITLITLCATIIARADIPARYYSAINGLKDAELKTALSNIISNRASVSSYQTYYNNMPTYFQKTDVYPGTKRWWDMYSDIPLYAPSFKGLHREHSFPKSWWGGTIEVPIFADLNNLFPAEGDANMAKSNYPLGTVSPSDTKAFDNGVVKVGYAVGGQGGGAAKVFEPADEYKGDFARTYFYMVTCYQNTTWAKNNMFMLQQNTYPTLSGWAVQLLLKWHKDDPVSEKELNRNEQVYLIQNNRNPFIDYPALVDYIWGDKKGELFYESNASEPVGTPTLVTPVQGMALDFSQVAVGNSTTAKLYFKGEYLTGSLSLAITGTDKSLFTLSTRSIPSSQVNNEAGYWLTVTYKPTSVGQHSARLIVSDGGITGSLGIQLIGECLAVPTLTPFKALPATDITTTSYTAQWEEAAEVVDYYIVSRTRYYSGNSATEELPAETNSLVIEDYDPSVGESYNVRSVRLGYESPRSNEIYIDRAGIDAVTGDMQLLGTAFFPGGVRFVCPVPHTQGIIYDMQGRTIMLLDEIENNQVIYLPVGVYLIVTHECPTPQRIIVR